MVIVFALLLLTSRKLPPSIAARFRAFRDATDEMAHDAGRSVAGIHGKPAAEALTVDNQTAELYDPAAFQQRPPPPRPIKRLARRFFASLRALVRRILS